jgi:hypothetical protein
MKVLVLPVSAKEIVDVLLNWRSSDIVELLGQPF